MAKEQHIAGWKAAPPKIFKKLGLTPNEIAELTRAMVGTVAVPGDPAYQQDEAHWNHAFNDHPAIIAFCEVPADVRHCLAFARRHKVPFTCRSGGHSTAGYCLTNGGLVIDISSINDIFVDLGTMTATIGAGANFHKVNAILDSYGVHTPGGGCPDVGVGGYMQGGGYGFTSRMFGMNCDNVLQVRVMLADGTIVTANSVEHPDLFWAVRGGTGNNFGVVLDITFQVHPLGELWGFGLRWPLAEAPRVLHHLQQRYTLTNGTRTLGYQGVFTVKKGKPYFMARGMVNGSEEAGQAAIAGMRSIGKPVLEIHKTGSYRELNDLLLNDIDSGIPPTQNGFPMKEDKFSAFLARTLTVDEWSEVTAQYLKAPSPFALAGMEIYGAAASAGTSANAYVHRDVSMDFFVDTFWFEPKEESKAKKWLVDFRKLMYRFWNGHSYQNYPRRGDANYRWMFWGDAFPTLLAVKRRYDPDGVFRFPMDISPYPKKGKGDIRRSSAAALFPDR
jgi:FAD/FMN-containing dehydrogenase